MRPHLTRSLSAHLRETGDHSRLPFHPECPTCRRDRLAGTLASDELVSRRTQAAIAAGLFAFSAAGAPAAFGSPPDEIIEGTEEIVSGGDLHFELDGDGDQLPDVSSSPPGVPAPVADDEESEQVEQAPVSNVGDSSVDDADDATTKPAPVVAKPSPSAAASAPTPVTDPIQVKTPAPDLGPQPEAGETRWTVRQQNRELAAPAQGSSSSATRNDVAVAPAAVRVAPVQTAAEPESAPVTVRVVAPTSTRQAAKGKRFHTVQQGESLWSIAADVLGEDATSARIAREVQRLWELNEERIGTGQPDLLFPGTRLRLR